MNITTMYCASKALGPASTDGVVSPASMVKLSCKLTEMDSKKNGNGEKTSYL